MEEVNIRTAAYRQGYLDKQANKFKIPKSVKATYNSVGKLGLLGGAGGFLTSSDIENPAYRGAMTLVPAFLASRGRGKGIRNKQLKLNPTSPRLAHNAATRGRLTGLIGGTALSGGANTLSRMTKSIDSPEGQKFLQKGYELMDTAKKRTDELSNKAVAVGDKIGVAADAAKDMAGSGKGIMDFLSENKKWLAGGSAALILAILYSRMRAGQESAANAEYVRNLIPRRH